MCALMLTKALRSWSQTHCLQVLLLAGNWSLAKQMLFIIYDISATDLHHSHNGDHDDGTADLVIATV